MRDDKVNGQPDVPESGQISAALLGWYDAHARVMPWRTSPADRAAGIRPDPYRVWLSEVMLQQTTVAAVRAYFLRFIERWPTVSALAAAEDAEVMAEWAGLGYYARARNLLACARAVASQQGGQFPQTLDGLRKLPGIGPYTAAAMAAIAFDLPATVVDGNVERVMARLHNHDTPLPAAKSALTVLAETHTPQDRPGDYAQAVMDLGATICTPRNPACGICPLYAPCAARAAGTAPNLPRKTAKPPKPTRHGTVWAAFRADGQVLLELRPAKGLLGGMFGLPGDGWDGAGGPPPLVANWSDAGEVRHTFTHFHLILTVHTALTNAAPDRGQFQSTLATDLPTLMRRAHDLAAASLATAAIPPH